jgi:imidazolonepropionase-like amidohydrolase
LVKAGLTPSEALQAATLNPAKFFQATDSLGTLVPRRLADLVLLDADPLADIRNVRTIRVVVANGRYSDRATLDALVAPWEKKAHRQP